MLEKVSYLMKIRENTQKTIQMMRSRLGDVILRCDKFDSKGGIIKTEIVMFVPQPVTPKTIE
ncbi:hypothetical protein LCGC14_1740210 [marine sediment metagenome]|uniref:Uncharacterized protein n=1 Tax=marine sediment metagenome TaxID=412755 RepID=A0A0F9H6X5_9ZZZZ